MPEYICELCNKQFIQKSDYNKHKNKKAPCISLTVMKELTEKQLVKKDNQSELTNVFNNCLDYMRSEGLTGEKALRNLSYFLILKLIEPHFDKEIDINKCDEYEFEGYNDDEIKKLFKLVRFSNLIHEKDDNIPTNIKAIWDLILSVHPSTNKIFKKNKCFDIKHQSIYKKIIKELGSINLENTEYDVLGEAYEAVIQHIMTGKVLGQFFTPPPVKKLMIKLIQPKLHPDGKIDTCCDSTMGTGGFLIEYIKDILKQAKLKNIKLDWNFIKEVGIYGKEIESDTYQLAVSNMLISTGHMFEHLDNGDSIREPITRKFDNYLCNPPFGIKGLKFDELTINEEERKRSFPIKSDNAVSLFIQTIINSLKINGKCAVVLPHGQDLFSKANMYVTIREYLMKTCDLKEIIYLPAGIFEYTSIKTCVFFFVKKREGADVLETVIKTSKNHKEIGREYKFSKTHQTSVVKFYEYNQVTDEKHSLIDIDIKDIANNSYSLNYTEYMKDDIVEYEEGVVIKTLGDSCDFDIGGTPSRSKNEYYDNGNNLWVSVRELNGGYIYDTKEKLTDLGVKNSSVKLFEKGTILFSFKLSIGKTAIVGNPLYTNEAIAGISSKDNGLLNNKYLYYYLTINDFSKLGAGILGNGSLNKKSLAQIKIPIPSLERQQEIVNYCKNNDKLIKKLEQEIETNKEQAKLFIKSIVKIQANPSEDETDVEDTLDSEQEQE